MCDNLYSKVDTIFGCTVDIIDGRIMDTIGGRIVDTVGGSIVDTKCGRTFIDRQLLIIGQNERKIFPNN